MTTATETPLIAPSRPAVGIGSDDLLAAGDAVSSALRWAVEAELTGKHRLANYYTKKAVSLLAASAERKAANNVISDSHENSR